MLHIALWVLASGFLVVGVIPWLLALRFARYVRRERKLVCPDFTPRLTVILPCKGTDPGFEQNMRSVLEQDYPNFEVLFVVAEREDPARPALERLIAEAGGADARLLVAGIGEGRSQKLNNQLFALQHARVQSEAFVFVDSDVRVGPRFLRDLVGPLEEERVGATTGFRWYVPEHGGMGSYLQATWNGGGLPMLAHPRLAYAWGGAMAILRSTFEEAGVRQQWRNALTDDFPLTRAVQELGLRVKFVPRCLLPSHEDATLAGALEWTNRQTVICRVYYPRLWRAIFTAHAVQAGGLLAALALVVIGLAFPPAGFCVAPGALMLGVLPLEVTSGVYLWRIVGRILPVIGGWKRAVKHALLIPAAVVLILYNSIHSLLTRDICWRGIRYRLHSPARTEVLSTSLETGG